MSVRRTRLSARDHQIIDDVARHRIITNEVLHKRHFAGRRLNAASKVTSRLCRAQILAKAPLYHPRTYFMLGPEGAALAGVSVHRTYPLGPQALPTEYAALLYATMDGAPHRRLTNDELHELCPWLIAPLLEFPYCLNDSTEPPTLELIRVDLGGKPDHVARKCEADIQVRLPLREFRDWVAAGRFRLVVITGTTDKASAIEQALEEHTWPGGLLIHLAVVPELLQLTASLSDGA